MILLEAPLLTSRTNSCSTPSSRGPGSMTRSNTPRHGNSLKCRPLKISVWQSHISQILSFWLNRFQATAASHIVATTEFVPDLKSKNCSFRSYSFEIILLMFRYLKMKYAANDILVTVLVQWILNLKMLGFNGYNNVCH